MNTMVRASRIFKHLVNYYDLSAENAEIPAYIPQNFLQEGEFFIGIYENFTGKPDECIILTNFGIYVWHEIGLKFIAFKKIKSATVPPKEDGSNKFKISTIDGDLFDVPVYGGKGKFKDIYQFVRFIDRVVEDNKS